MATAVALAVLIGLLLVRPGGPRLADDTEHVQRTMPLPFLASGESIVQPFEAAEDDLSQVMVRFAVGSGVDGCDVEVVIRHDLERIAERRSACDELRQAELWVVGFEPLEDAEGLELEAVLTVRGEPSGPISLWGGPSLGTLPPAVHAGDPLEISAELHTAYDDRDRAIDHLPTALDRIDGYGPFWHEPAVVVLTGFIALACLVGLVAAWRRPMAIALVIVFAVAKGVLWSVVISPMEGPDENSHFAYAQFMAEQHRIPRSNEAQFDIERPYSEQLELGYRESYHQWSQWPGNRPDFSEAGRRRAAELLEGTSPEAGGHGSAAGYAPYYYAPAAALYWLAPDNLDDQLAWMRLWNVALGAAGAWLSILIGRRLFPGSEPAALALGVAVAAQPMYSQQMAVVNNDGLVIVAGFAALLAALHLAAPRASGRWVLIGALAAGIAIATKQFGAAWALVLPAAWALGRYRTPRQDRRPWWRDVVRAAGGVLATYGAWAAVATLLHFPATAVQTFNPEPGPRTLRAFLSLHQRDGLLPLRARWVDQFWGQFGGLTLVMPEWVQGCLTAAAAVVLVAIAAWAAWSAFVWLSGRAPRVTGARSQTWVPIAVCVAAIAVTLSVLHAADFLQFRRNGRLELLQGRYALMILPAALALPALLASWAWPRLRGAAPMIGIAGGVVALNIGAVALMIERFYL